MLQNLIEIKDARQSFALVGVQRSETIRSLVADFASALIALGRSRRLAESVGSLKGHSRHVATIPGAFATGLRTALHLCIAGKAVAVPCTFLANLGARAAHDAVRWRTS